jgi:hypothetical protein
MGIGMEYKSSRLIQKFNLPEIEAGGVAMVGANSGGTKDE